MEEIRQFQGGMNKDVQINNMPPNAYRHAENLIQITEDGNIGGLTTERGFTDKVVGFPEGFKVIGKDVLEDTLIVFLVGSGGASQIGTIDLDYNYTRVVPGEDGDDLNTELGFSANYPIDCTSRKLFTGDRMIYFTDNYNSMRAINIDNPPKVGQIVDETSVIPEQSLPILDYVSMDESAGNLKVGIYYFLTQYLNSDLTPTTYGIQSFGVPVVNETRAGGALAYDGEYLDFGKVNKAIKLRATNIDQSYSYIRLIVVYYEGVTDTLTAEAMPIRNVTGTTMNFVYTGDEENVEDISIEELRVVPVSYTKAKAVTQKDNTLFWSNLKDASLDFDEELQKIANDCLVEYTIDEVPVTDRLGIGIDGFTVVDAYIKDTTTTPEDSTVVVSFSSEADQTTASDVNNYVVKFLATLAYGSVTIDDSAGLLDTFDTITVGTAVFVATNGTVTPGDDTFDASGTEEETAASLVAQINESTTLSSAFSAVQENNKVTIYYNTPGVVGNSQVLTYTNNGGPASATIVGFANGTDTTSYTPISLVLNQEATEVELLIASPIPSFATVDVSINSNEGDVLALTDFPIAQESEGLSLSESNGAFYGYKDEAYTFYRKGFRRNEVYSLGMVVNFKDSGESFVYHIPGNVKDTNPTTGNFIPATKDTPGYTNLTGTVGTYVSETDYPLNQYYPGLNAGDDTTVGAINNKIRHHKMPSLEQEPHFRNELISIGGAIPIHVNNRFIRILGLKITLNKAMSPKLASRVQSISFVRQRRNSAQNRSVWTQGLPSRYVKTSNNYDGNGNAIEEDEVFKRMPFFNNTGFISHDTYGKGPSSVFKYDNIQDRIMALDSPDANLLPLNPNNLIGAKLVPVLHLQGKESYRLFKKSIHQSVADISVKNDLRWAYLGWLGVHYYSASAPTSTEGVTITHSEYVAQGSKQKFISLGVKPVDNTYTGRHLHIETAPTENIVDFGNDNTLTIIHKANLGFLESGSLPSSDKLEPSSSTYGQNLLSVETVNNNQYAEIGSGEYVLMYTSTTVPTTPGVTYNNVFGGDTFVGPYAFRNCDLWAYKAIRGTASFGIVDTSYSVVKADTQSPGGSIAPARMDLKALTYLFVESDANVAYRHQYVDRTDPNALKQEPNYYPREDWEDVLKVQSQEGDSKGYNVQYSYEPTIKTYNTKSAQATIVSNYETRTIYSKQAVLDESLDSFRIYPQNNYHDLPKNTGPIWDNFVHANILYLHTPKALYRTYVNDVTQQATTLGQVVLGVGGLFGIPSKPVVTSSEGYAGSISQFAGVNTPFGYIFPDVLQGRMFLLVGEQLTEIDNGLSQFFKANLSKDLVLSGNYKDNPFTSFGITAGYDYANGRYLMTKHGEESFTLSFSFLSKSWVSFHTYFPKGYIGRNKDLLIFTEDLKLYQHNVGDYGDFENVVNSSVLEVVFNDNAASEKVFDNFVLHTRSYDNEKTVKLDTFTSMEARTDNRNTGVYTLVPVGVMASYPPQGSLNAVFLKNKYNIAIPGSAVIDEEQDITNEANLDKTLTFKPRIKGDFMLARFVYNNENNFKFVINFIATRYRANAN